MGLRQYINDLEISRKINYSERGKKFENSDFARSVEFPYSCAMKLSKKSGLKNTIKEICFSYFAPIISAGTYIAVKDDKINRPDGYQWFSNNPDFVLNHHL